MIKVPKRTVGARRLLGHGWMPHPNDDEYRRAYLLVGASPADIALFLGFAPDLGWAEGDDWIHEGRSRGPRKFSRSFIECGLDDQQPLADQIAALLDRLEPSDDGLRAMAVECETTLECVIHSRGSFNWTLDFSLQERIAALGIGFEIAAYPGDYHEEITRYRERLGFRRGENEGEAG